MPKIRAALSSPTAHERILGENEESSPHITTPWQPRLRPSGTRKEVAGRHDDGGGLTP